MSFPQTPKLRRILDQQVAVPFAERDTFVSTVDHRHDGGVRAARELASVRVRVDRHFCAATYPRVVTSETTLGHLFTTFTPIQAHTAPAAE